MPGLLVFLVVILAGVLLLVFGPVGWRTYCKGAIVAAVPLVGQILDYAQAWSGWNSVLDAKTAMWIMGAVGVLGLIFTNVNRRLYGTTPKA